LLETVEVYNKKNRGPMEIDVYECPDCGDRWAY